MDTPNPRLVKRVAIVGPECTGKTVLSQALAAHYHTVWVPEFARTFIDQLNRPYNRADLLTIARGQLDAEDRLEKVASRLLICDTNLLVIKVWSEYKYGICEAEILQKFYARHYDHHLLTYIDIPWEDDPQREHPDKRHYFFELYKKELHQLKVPFSIVSGSLPERVQLATSIINSLLSDKE